MRLTNRDVKHRTSHSVQVQYVDRVVEVPVDRIVETRVEVPMSSQVEVPVDRIVEVEKIVHVLAEPVDLQPLHEKCQDLQIQLLSLADSTSDHLAVIKSELEMQRQALVALRTQRDIDRSRRLQLLRRLGQARDQHKAQLFKVKLAIAAGILLSIVSLVVKL